MADMWGGASKSDPYVKIKLSNRAVRAAKSVAKKGARQDRAAAKTKGSKGKGAGGGGG